jgi:hypothetical protein
MDPATIGTAVVAFLSPYLAEGGKAAAKKAGEALVAAIERRFKDQPAAQEALEDMKYDPQDDDIQAALRVQLKKAMQADEAFAAELAGLVEEAQAAAPATYRAAVYGSGAVAQGPGAVAAGERGVASGGSAPGTIITGDGNVVGDHSTSRVQRGGIHADRIEADNVVDGVQTQGATPEDAGRLVELAQAAQHGGITAGEIEAGSVVSGLQFLTGAPPETPAALQREVAALRQQVKQAITAGEVTSAGDAEDVTDALDKAEAELDKPEPDGKRVVRKLETTAEILTGAAETAQAARNVGLQIIKLAPVAVALHQLAQAIF